MSRRFQFVWWGWRRWRFGRSAWTGSLAEFYRYSVHFGPLEVRRWTDRARQMAAPSPEAGQ